MRPIAAGGYKAAFFQVSCLGTGTGNGVKLLLKKSIHSLRAGGIKDAEPVGRQSQLPAETEFEAWRLWCRNLGTLEDND